MTVIDFIMQFKTDLWSMMSDFIISSAVIAILSSLFTEAIKISMERVFLKTNVSKFFGWLFNTLLVLVASIFFVLVFRKSVTLLGGILYTVLISLLSWAISILAYTLIIKLFVTGLKILYSKTKCYYLDSEREVLKSTLLYTKEKELMSEEIILHGLETQAPEQEGGRP